MANATNTNEGYVKKETMWLAILIALAVGFFGGVVFSAFKSPATPEQSAPQAKQQPAKQQNRQQAQNTKPDYSAQISALEQELVKNPSNTEAWTQLGNYYFEEQKFAKSINAYNKSLELAPNNADVLTDLGVMYRRNGNPEKAIASFQQASKINPNHPSALFNSGIVSLYDLNDKEAALKAWGELVAIHPDAKAPNGQLVSEIIIKVKSQQPQQ